MNPLELTGRARTHVVDCADPPCTLHVQALQGLLAMRAAAAVDGLDLWPVSSYRDFDRQVAIWNAKFRGERLLLDRQGCEFDGQCLDPAARIDAILWWSALPGASRHHWGTDLDVIDRAALLPQQRPQLVPAEFAPDGPFARLESWLVANLARFEFFRPYRLDRGGVSPEAWNLSYAPLAVPALEQVTLDVLAAAIEASSIEGRDQVLQRLPELHARYVRTIDAP